MGNRGAKLAGLERATMSVNDSATQIIDQVSIVLCNYSE